MKKLTNRASIPELLKDMSLDEKLTLLTGRSAFLAGGCPERDIPNPLFLDGGTGFNTMQMEIEASYRVIEEKNGAVDPESITSPMAGLTLGMAPVLSVRTVQNLRRKKRKQLHGSQRFLMRLVPQTAASAAIRRACSSALQ